MKRIVVHAPGCRAAEGHTIIRASQADPYALPHRTCIPGGGGLSFAGTNVVEVAEDVPEHAYRSSMLWPAGQKHPLCGVCRQPKDKHEETS
jgi:hypothetical protein